MRPAGGGNPNLDMTGGGMVCGAYLILRSITHFSGAGRRTRRGKGVESRTRPARIERLADALVLLVLHFLHRPPPWMSQQLSRQSAAGGFHAHPRTARDHLHRSVRSPEQVTGPIQALAARLVQNTLRKCWLSAEPLYWFISSNPYY